MSIMRVGLLALVLVAHGASANPYTCRKVVPPIVLAKLCPSANHVPKPNDPPNAVCQNTKGVCAADKVMLCHAHPTTPLTLCIPEVSVTTHRKQHPNDFCGCCGPTEKTIASYCVGKAQGVF